MDAGMDENGVTPSTVIVMADDLCMYAWSGAGDCLGHSGLKMVAQCFSEYPRLSEIVDVEYELWDWVAHYPCQVTAAATAWQEFHLQGLILARRLADLLRPLAVEVYYRCHPDARSHPHMNMGPL